MILARVADNLYWMSRYLERAEFSAGLVSLQVQRLPTGTAAEVAKGWRLVFAGLNRPLPSGEALGVADDDDYLFADGYTLTDLLTFEGDGDGSIMQCLAAARENARQARGRIGAGAWSALNREYLRLREIRLVDIWQRDPVLLYRDIAEGAQRFHGICDKIMRRGEEWAFIQLGRHLERAQLVGALLQAHRRRHAGPGDEGDWPMLLRACSAFDAYGQLHGGLIDPLKVTSLLVRDAQLAYSLHYCARRLRASLRIVDPAPPNEITPEPFTILDRLGDLLEPPAAAATGDLSSGSDDLGPICRLFLQFHDAIARCYVYYPVNGQRGRTLG